MNKSFVLCLILSMLAIRNLPAQIHKDCHCIKNEVIDSIYESFMVEEKPAFPGGDAEVIKYIAGHMPNSTLDSNVFMVSTFYLRFVIDTIGQLKNLCMMRPIYPDQLSNFERNILEMVSQMPKWIPARRNGKKVPVWFIVPIRVKWQ